MEIALIAGSRGITDCDLIFSEADRFISSNAIILSGGAKGPDTVAVQYAEVRGMFCMINRAEWKKHGRSAGHIRNAEMGRIATSGLVFWDAVSRGSQSIKILRKNGIPARVVVVQSSRIVSIEDF